MINHMGALATCKPWPYGSPGLMYTTCEAATCFPQMFSQNNIKLHGSPGHMEALAIYRVAHMYLNDFLKMGVA